jgi:hypothetical protein
MKGVYLDVIETTLDMTTMRRCPQMTRRARGRTGHIEVLN